MKFIILLSVLVVVTHQQYNRQFLMPRSWLPFSYHQPSHYEEHPQHGIYDYSPYNPLGPVFILNDDETTGSMRMENQYVVDEHQQRYVEPRVKDYGPHRKFLKSIQQHQKFLFGSSTTQQQPFTKTATFFITSTCTALTVSSCIPRLNLLPAAPSAVPNCRRKREFNPGHLGEDNSEFDSIMPSQVRMVYPTALPDATMNDDTRRIDVDIVSSKEENVMDESSKGISVSNEEPVMNHGRFLHLYFLTSVTKTTWRVVSSVFTSTYVPAVNLNCLPPSYIICPESGK